jgi:hypothetical protein
LSADDGGRWKTWVSRVVVRSERFELPTLGFEVRCSIQLSYERSIDVGDTRLVSAVLWPRIGNVCRTLGVLLRKPLFDLRRSYDSFWPDGIERSRTDFDALRKPGPCEMFGVILAGKGPRTARIMPAGVLARNVNRNVPGVRDFLRHHALRSPRPTSVVVFVAAVRYSVHVQINIFRALGKNQNSESTDLRNGVLNLRPTLRAGPQPRRRRRAKRPSPFQTPGRHAWDAASRSDCRRKSGKRR